MIINFCLSQINHCLQSNIHTYSTHNKAQLPNLACHLQGNTFSTARNVVNIPFRTSPPPLSLKWTKISCIKMTTDYKRYTLLLSQLIFYLFEHGWPVGRMKRAYVGDVSAKTAMNTAALIAHQHTAVYRSPARICTQRPQKNHSTHSTYSMRQRINVTNNFEHKKGGKS